MKKVFIIHGWGGSPDSNWFPWMKKELEKENIEVVAPQMPNADFPRMGEWLSFMRQIIGKADENVFLIGHSLGVIAILCYLESLKEDEKIGGIVLAAGFSQSIGIPEIENFFETGIEYEKIKNSVEKIVIINSDNDPYVPLEQGKIMEEKLGGKLVVLHNAFHINEGNGYFEFPVGLEKLKIIFNT